MHVSPNSYCMAWYFPIKCWFLASIETRISKYAKPGYNLNICKLEEQGCPEALCKMFNMIKNFSLNFLKSQFIFLLWLFALTWLLCSILALDFFRHGQILLQHSAFVHVTFHQLLHSLAHLKYIQIQCFKINKPLTNCTFTITLIKKETLMSRMKHTRHSCLKHYKHDELSNST